VAEVLATCDLTDRCAQNAMTLSGGELARAMLARALVGDPDILIVDEPIAGLDPRHAMDTARRLEGLARTGKVVVAALHDLTLAGRHANRVFALRDDRTAGEGETRRVLDAPLIRAVFEVEARVTGAGENFAINYCASA
jgi:iron complex transport system ATP-binding protein